MIAYTSFVIDYTELKLALTVQIINFEPNLHIRREISLWVNCVLMSKNVNNGVSKDSPYRRWEGGGGGDLFCLSSWYNNANQFSSLPRDPVSSGRQHTAGQPYSRLCFCKRTLLYLQRLPYHPTLLRICPVDCIGKPHIRHWVSGELSLKIHIVLKAQNRTR